MTDEPETEDEPEDEGGPLTDEERMLIGLAPIWPPREDLV